MTQTPEERQPPDSGQERPARLVLDPQALSLEDVSRLLSRAGGRPVTLDVLQADIDAGAPANADGTINLIHYAAWLVKEIGRGD